MKKVIIVIILVFAFGNIANAQIKVVGNEYMDSLTATRNYYKKDLLFDSLFQQVNLKEKFKRLWAWTDGLDYKNEPDIYTYNLDGDTLYIPQVIPLKNPSKGKCLSFVLETTDSTVLCLDYVPKGYYTISGYVFCNGGELIKKYRNDLQWNDFPAYHGGLGNKWMTDEDKIKMIKEDFLAYESEIKEKGIGNYLQYDYVILTSIDEPKYTFYCRGLHDRIFFMNSGSDNYFRFLNTAFYTDFKKYFLRKEVAIMHNFSFGGYGYNKYYNSGIVRFGMYNNELKYEHEFIKPGDIFTDALNKEKLKIQDSIFMVKDILLKDDELYCILEGRNTGVFSIIPININYSTKVYENYYSVTESESGLFEINHFQNPYFQAYSKVHVKGSSQDWESFILINLDDYNSIKGKIESRCKQIIKNKEATERQKRLAEENALKKRKQEHQQRKAQEQMEFRQRMIAKYGDEKGDIIADKQIATGMTTEMVRDAWGRPLNTYRSTTKYGQSEVWCYNYKTRVYFYNGKVVRIDE